MFLSEIKSSPKISERVITEIFNSIEEGRLKVGDELPSEIELAKIFNISRGALREGLSILEFCGIIDNEGKKKTINKGATSIKKALEIVRLSNNDDILHDFIELRKVLEPLSIQLACDRATKEDINKIEKAVRSLEEDIDDMDADYAFHISLAQSSRNVFLAAIEDLIITILRDVREKAISVEGRKEKIPGEHRAILDAIIDKNPKLAKEKMIEHLNNMEENLKLVVEEDI